MREALYEAKQCGTCGAPIFWLRHTGTGRAAPIDVAASENGNCEVLLDRDAYSTYGPRVAAEKRAAGVALHTNHFVTCPQRKTWARVGRQTS